MFTVYINNIKLLLYSVFILLEYMCIINYKINIFITSYTYNMLMYRN